MDYFLEMISKRRRTEEKEMIRREEMVHLPNAFVLSAE